MDARHGRNVSTNDALFLSLFLSSSRRLSFSDPLSFAVSSILDGGSTSPKTQPPAGKQQTIRPRVFKNKLEAARHLAISETRPHDRNARIVIETRTNFLSFFSFVLSFVYSFVRPFVRARSISRRRSLSCRIDLRTRRVEISGATYRTIRNVTRYTQRKGEGRRRRGGETDSRTVSTRKIKFL